MTQKPCFYCSFPTHIYCSLCQKYCCNNRCTSSVSHIIFHLTKNHHTSVSIEDNQLKCIKCESKNIFNLGFINKSIEANKKDINTEESTESNDSMPEEKINLKLINKLICRNCVDEEWTPVVRERCFGEEIVSGQNIPMKLSKKDLTKIEDDKILLPSTKLVYSIKEYRNINIALLKHECTYEQKMKEKLVRKNIKVRFEAKSEKRKKNIDLDEVVMEKNYYCFFSLDDVESKLFLGDEILLSSQDVLIKCFIVQNNYTDEIKTRIYSLDGEIKKSDLYTVEYVWKNIGQERMIYALQNMYRMNQQLLECILGSKYQDQINLSTSEHDKQRTINPNVNLNSLKGFNTPIISPPNLPFLNESQENAVKAALNGCLTLIQGPPGTGKTVTTAAIVYNLVQKKQGKILVVANSNTAIDHITEKIHRTGVKVVRIVSKRREYMKDSLSFLSLHEQIKMFQKLIPETKSKSSSGDDVLTNLNEAFDKKAELKHKIRRKISKCIIENADVITCTCVTAGQKLINDIVFPYVLIDEAVQCTEPLSIIPLMYGCEKLILIGDHKQLGPIILDKKTEKAGFKRSLFERLISLGVVPYLLNVQYRMHPMLSEWPSNSFYNGSLKNGITSLARMNKTELPFPTFFYVCYGNEESSSTGTSFLNVLEANYVKNIIQSLIKSGIKESQIGVITPYEGQRAFILSKLKDYNIEELEISNVDAFQGREKDYIIVSLVRSNQFQGIGFVSDKRRLNVTLTRAKYGCVIIGNPVTLIKNPMWKDLVEFYQEKDLVYEGSIGSLKQTSIGKNNSINLASLLNVLDE